MRLYDVAVTSLAIGAPVKWTDNLIAQAALGRERESQEAARFRAAR